MPNTPRRWPRPLAIVAIALAVLAVAALGAAGYLRHRLEAIAHRMVGPRGSIEAMRLRPSGLYLEGVRVRGDQTGAVPWPTDDELRIDQMLLVPDLASYLGGSGPRRIRRIDVHGGRLVLVRDRPGKLHIVPGMKRPKPPGPQEPERPTVIERLQLSDVTVDYYDAHVRQPAQHVQIAHIGGHLGPQQLPHPTLPMEIDLRGVGKGVHHDGQVALAGQLTPATRESDLRLALAGIDLVTLQPYLIKVDEGGVRKGDMDLRIHGQVKSGRVDAPGTITLRGLELTPPHDGGLSTFAGLPRRAVLAAISRDGRIQLDFTLQGRLDDPKFKLDDDLSTRIAGGLASAIGVTVGGVVEGVSDVIDGVLKH